MTAADLQALGYRAQPWVNGGGTTWEVARFPQGPGDFDWRISIAEIDGDGLFSCLPGVDRSFTLASGSRISLQINGVRCDLGFGKTVAFSGDDEVSCVVDEPVRALNVMTRRGRASARVEILPLFAACPVPAETIVVNLGSRTALVRLGLVATG